jgi:hypothetical protein
MAAVGSSETLLPIVTPQKIATRGLVPPTRMMTMMAIIKVLAVIIIIIILIKL